MWGMTPWEIEEVDEIWIERARLYYKYPPPRKKDK